MQNKYPWNDWLRRKNFVIKKGRHYTCQTHGMVGQLRNAASRLELPIRLRVTETSITINPARKSKG